MHTKTQPKLMGKVVDYSLDRALCLFLRTPWEWVMPSPRPANRSLLKRSLKPLYNFTNMQQAEGLLSKFTEWYAHN